jgi:hypothetical protein
MFVKGPLDHEFTRMLADCVGGCGIGDVNTARLDCVTMRSHIIIIKQTSHDKSVVCSNSLIRDRW